MAGRCAAVSLFAAIVAALPSCQAPPRVSGDSRPADGRPVGPAAQAVADLPPPMPRSAEFRRGVSLGLFVSDPDPAMQRAWYAQLLAEIHALGATDVQIVLHWRQADVTATQIDAYSAGVASEEVLRAAIRQARVLGLRVALMPVLQLGAMRRGEWRGTLRPADRAAWWVSYGTRLDALATLAAEEEVDLLIIGSELVSMERDEAEFRALIARTRARFSGALSYSANWDHFEPIGFWDALDVVGINAYQPLAAPGGAIDDAALDRGWGPYLARLRAWAGAHGRRYLFTEVGYPATPWSLTRPWDHAKPGPARTDLQTRGYRSLYRVWHADPRLAGLYAWNWTGIGGPDDPGYSPRGRPAARVLRHWYAGP